MVIRKALAALAAVGTVLGSTAAAAAPADVSGLRSASASDKAEGIAGGSFVWIIAALVAAGVIAVIVSDNDEEEPVSP